MHCFRYVSAQCLVGYFDRLGVLETGKTLEYLGIVGQEEMLDMGIISQAVNDHVSSMLSYECDSVTRVVTALLSDELVQSQQTVGSLTQERDNLTEEMQVCELSDPSEQSVSIVMALTPY